MNVKQELINFVREGFFMLTSFNTGLGVIIGGVISNNVLYYLTGLTTKSIPIIIPCCCGYFIWGLLMGIIEDDIEWGA
jgi:hypothetical protein